MKSNLTKDEVRVRYAKLDTSNVADVLDKRDYRNQGLAPDFISFSAGTEKLAGWAYTISGKMTPYDLTGDLEKMEACSKVSPGEITVWHGDGNGICYFGELIALGLKEKGCAGALLDGGIRDIRLIQELNLPIYARYRTPIQSIGRWKVVEWQNPIYLPGATTKLVLINPGDFILGDADGVIVIPASCAESVLLETERLTNIEHKLRKELAEGLPLPDALLKYGHV